MRPPRHKEPKQMSSVGINLTIVRGTLSRPPSERQLPSGDTVVAFEVTVRPDVGPADSVPVSWVGAPGSCLGWDTGDEVVVLGRVRRRFFRAGGATQSRTEIAASSVAHVRQKAKVRQAVELALSEVAAVTG
jgi:single-strand DNA-binding protein